MFNCFLPKDKIIIGFDHECKICMRFANFLKKFDKKQKIIIDSAQNPSHKILQKISKSIRLKKIASYRTSDEKKFYGFDTIYEAVRRIPFFFILSCIMWMMKFTAGPILYYLISHIIRKKIGCKNKI